MYNDLKRHISSGQIRYHYYYDKPNSRDFYEVPYEAQRDGNNIKPRSIETWYPSNGVDKDVLDKCAMEFCKKFLGIEADNVEFKEVILFEDALNKYLEEMKRWENNPQIIFTDSLIEQMESRMNILKEKALEILNRSIK